MLISYISITCEINFIIIFYIGGKRQLTVNYSVIQIYKHVLLFVGFKTLGTFIKCWLSNTKLANHLNPPSIIFINKFCFSLLIVCSTFNRPLSYPLRSLPSSYQIWEIYGIELIYKIVYWDKEIYILYKSKSDKKN